MKPDIHPDNYRTVLFYDSGADQGWLIRSCANTHGKTMVWKDGIEYPLFSLDTSSASHPVYTVLSSLKTAKKRHRDCQIVRRKGKVYVICKSNPRFKARQR